MPLPVAVTVPEDPNTTVRRPLPALLITGRTLLTFSTPLPAVPRFPINQFSSPRCARSACRNTYAVRGSRKNHTRSRTPGWFVTFCYTRGRALPSINALCARLRRFMVAEHTMVSTGSVTACGS